MRRKLHTEQLPTEREAAPSRAADATPHPHATRARVLSALSPPRIAADYVLLVMCVVFSIWVPDTFPQWATARQVLTTNAVPAMVALTLVIPLSCGIFDISVPNTMTLSGVIATYAMVNSGWPMWIAITLAVVVSV